MNRHRSLSVVCLVAGFSATSFGLVALSQGASAHSPSVSASCTGVVLQASNYDAAYANQWSVTIDGASTSGTFGGTLDQSFSVPQDRVFTWSGRIAAFNGEYEQVNSGSLGPCVTTTPPTTTPPTTVLPSNETETPTPPPPTDTDPPTEPSDGVPTEVLGVSETRGPDSLPDTGASVSAPFEVDGGMVSTDLARSSLMAGLLLLLAGAWQLWRRESV